MKEARAPTQEVFKCLAETKNFIDINLPQSKASHLLGLVNNMMLTAYSRGLRDALSDLEVFSDKNVPGCKAK